ncbi:MAG: cytochrome c, partial [bacterium]|nr:cytochrome c [bacterium]
MTGNAVARTTFRSVGIGRWLLVLLLVAFAMVWTSQRTPAAAQSADEGHELFEAKCTSCHTIGGGPLVGPDLEGVTSRREPDWLARWLSEPDAM